MGVSQMRNIVYGGPWHIRDPCFTVLKIQIVSVGNWLDGCGLLLA